jgi:hypothetical protein
MLSMDSDTMMNLKDKVEDHVLDDLLVLETGGL